MLRAAFPALTGRILPWRLLIAVGVPGLVVALILVPAWVRLDKAETALARASADLDWLATRAEGFAPVASNLNQPPPRAVDLERILQETGMRPALRGLSDQAEGRILLSLDEVAFQRLVQLLHRLETDHAGALREVAITRGRPGFASATLVIQGAPG